jgi:hypothetical protein
MDFKLNEVLNTVGPTASLIFAAWIYLSFLQQRYSSGYENYRKLISQYRDGNLSGKRKDVVAGQILLYKKRFELMRMAMRNGIYAAIVLILAIVVAAFNAIFPDNGILKYVGAAFAISGLLLVILAAAPVLLENRHLQDVVESDLADLPDLSEKAGQSDGYRKGS